jgi:carboxypeptidase Taq
MPSYAALETHYRRLWDLRNCEAMLSWDEATMMPSGGGASRAEALATLRGIIHDRSADPALGELLDAALDESLSPWQKANLVEMRRAWLRATAIPHDLVEACSRAENRSEQAWRSLRPRSDWAGFIPLLAEVVRLKREMAAALGSRLGLAPYDALLDGFEPGARAAQIQPIFDRLRQVLPDLIAQVVDRQRGETVRIPRGPFPIDRQRALGVELMRRLGFDFARGRLDTSHHPFCGGVPSDVRITTRYAPDDFAKSLMGVLHETGHAQYEQNLPGEWLAQPVGAARGMSIHESQSLLWELQVCRSREFFDFAAPLIRDAFPDAAAADPDAFTVDNLRRLATRVRPSFIRVDADEVTYPCHVLLRFDLERKLIAGELDIANLPEAWDVSMRELLGISTGDNHRDGCMQDVHWPAGLFGYFPAYTLGALTAAQLYRTVRQAVPALPSQIAAGDFSTLRNWLREHVWSVGSSRQTSDLLRSATGSTIDTAAFEAHLRERYLG